MVATTLATASATTAATMVLAKFIPPVADPKLQAGIQAAVGLVAVLGSIKVQNDYAKGALIGVGIGLMADAAGTAFPQVAA